MPDRILLHLEEEMPQPELESESRRVDRLRVHATTALGAPANAPLVVLVHGLGVSSRYFAPLMRALAGDVRMFAPDLPGTGRSESPRHALDVGELAVALQRWLDVRRIERASIIANSMGCQVVSKLAVVAPERVDRLVLVGPTVDPRWRSLRRQIARWLLEATREPLAIFPLLVRDYLRYGPRRFLATGRHALAHRIEDDAPYIEAPTLVLRGARDSFVSAEWMHALARQFPNGRAATVAGAAHAAHFMQPEEVARVVLPFLLEPSRGHRACTPPLSKTVLEARPREGGAHGLEESSRAPRDGRSARGRVSS